VRQVVEALRDFVDPFEDLPTDAGDREESAEPAAEQRTGCIHFERLMKLHEPYVLEKTIEVYGPLRGDDETRLFRLQALRSTNEGGFQVAIHRQVEVPLASLCPAGGLESTAGREVEFWEPYDLIWSGLPTVDKALYEVLGFLEMRCD